jgi:hypothetical protein
VLWFSQRDTAKALNGGVAKCALSGLSPDPSPTDDATAPTPQLLRPTFTMRSC